MSEAQYMTALARANEIRLSRSNVKARIRAGGLSIGEALCLECCGSMTIFQLLCAQRGWGCSTESSTVKGTKAIGLLARLEISPYRQVRQLTDRQRAVIAGACDSERIAA